MKNETYMYFGYFVVENADFETAVPLFTSMEWGPFPEKSSNHPLFYQRVYNFKIQNFVYSGLRTDDISIVRATEAQSKVLKALGDDAVFVQTNISSDVIFGFDRPNYISLVRDVLQKEFINIYPIVGLELARLVGDRDLEERYFNKVARLVGGVSEKIKLAWLNSFQIDESKFFSAIQKEVKFNNEEIDAQNSALGQFSNFGFGTVGVRYFGSTSFLKGIDLFDEHAMLDPITRNLRPIFEYDTDRISVDVVFFTMEDFFSADGISIESMVRDIYERGALLVFVSKKENFVEEVRQLILDTTIRFWFGVLDRMTVLIADDVLEVLSFIRRGRSMQWLKRNRKVGLIVFDRDVTTLNFEGSEVWEYRF